MFADLLTNLKKIHNANSEKKRSLYTANSSEALKLYFRWWYVLVAPNPHRLHAMEFTRMKLLSN